MPSAQYERWTIARNKDDLGFYSDIQFRRDYTRLQMSAKADLFQNLAWVDVEAVMASVWNADSQEIRIVSFGCGPGSDLVGLLGAVESLCRLNWNMRVGSRLRCVCTGVDAFDWNQDSVNDRISAFNRNGILSISYKFVKLDMHSFASECAANGTDNFDFICLGFVDAGRNLELVGAGLPILLSRHGRVLVLDNNISSVRQLAAYYGFKCGFFTEKICMHSRGVRSGLYPSVLYSPSRDSPYYKYKLQEQEQMRQREQQSLRWERPAKVYHYQAREQSWCERNCVNL